MHFSKKCDVIRYGRSRLFPHTYPIIVSVLLDVRNQTYKDTLPFETRSAKWNIYIISTPYSKNTKKRRSMTTLFCSGDEFWSTPHADETHLKTNPNCFLRWMPRRKCHLPELKSETKPRTLMMYDGLFAWGLDIPSGSALMVDDVRSYFPPKSVNRTKLVEQMFVFRYAYP